MLRCLLLALCVLSLVFCGVGAVSRSTMSATSVRWAVATRARPMASIPPAKS